MLQEKIDYKGILNPDLQTESTRIRIVPLEIRIQRKIPDPGASRSGSANPELKFDSF